HQLRDLAQDSFGIRVATDVYKLQIQLLLQQILLLEEQLKTVEDEMAELVAAQDQYLTTITGIGPVTAAVILSEVADHRRFELSKRGSPYRRRAIWQAAFIASNRDPALSLYYQNLRKRGKHHGTAVGAVCRKLVNIIFAVWTKGKPYEVHINPDLKTD